MTNILDKTDVSMVKLGTGDKMVPKRERYNWKPLGRRGEFRLLSKHLIYIDGRYQRDQISDAKVMEIARNFDWTLFGVLLVVVRNDGTHWAIDGGHRLRGSLRRDDVDVLPCMVFGMEQLSDEAQAFLGNCLFRTAISAIAKHNASLCANDETANKVGSLLLDCGLEVKSACTTNRHVKCIKAITDMVAEDESLAGRVLRLSLSLCGDSPVDSLVLKGLFFLARHFRPKFDFLHEYGEKLSQFSQPELLKAINTARIELGLGGTRTIAIGILSLVNKNKTAKHRLVLMQQN